MKEAINKFISAVSIALSIAAAPCLASCGNAVYTPDAYACDTVQNIESYGGGMIDTPSKILFSSNDVGLLCYHSKADGKNYVFSPDPLNYSGDDSPASIFADTSKDEYCNGRLYGVFLRDIYSAALDGTDVKKIYSSNYVPKEDDYRDPFAMLSHYQQYLYFGVLNENGYALYRYDTTNGKIKNLTKDKDFEKRAYFFGKDRLYFEKSKESALFTANLDMSGIKELQGVKSGIYDGSCTYGIEYGYDGENTLYKGIYRDDLTALTHTLIFDNPSGDYMEVKCVTDDAIYYIVKEEVADLGKQNGETISNSFAKLYRIDKNGGNAAVVFDDPEYGIIAMYTTSEGLFALVTKYSVSDPENVTYDQYYAKLRTDSDGKITAVEKLEITR